MSREIKSRTRNLSGQCHGACAQQLPYRMKSTRMGRAAPRRSNWSRAGMRRSLLAFPVARPNRVCFRYTFIVLMLQDAFCGITGQSGVSSCAHDESGRTTKFPGSLRRSLHVPGHPDVA